MTRRIVVPLIAVAAIAAVPSASGDITLSDFSSFSLTGTYVDWDFGAFTSGATDFRVEASNFGGGWVAFGSSIDASGENTLEIVLTVNAANVATAFNVVLFSGGGATQAGFTFILGAGTQTLTADLNNPDFFNAGDLGSWDTSDIFNEWHLQGTFANNDHMDITFDNLALIPAPSSLALLGLGGVFAMRRRRGS